MKHELSSAYIYIYIYICVWNVVNIPVTRNSIFNFGGIQQWLVQDEIQHSYFNF